MTNMENEKMDDYTEVERLLLDNLYINGSKLSDLMSTGRLVVVGYCKECDYHYPPLTAVVDGEIKEVTPMRCSAMFGYVKPDGWCYKFRMDGKSYFDGA